MDRIICYYRVSTNRQDFHSQKSVVEKRMEREDLSGCAVDVITDKISGGTFTREGFEKMMRLVKLGIVRKVFVYKLDWLGRSTVDLILMIDELKKNGTAVVDGIDTSDNSPIGRAMIQMMGVFAELERSIISMRVRDGLAAAARGRFPGRPKGTTKIFTKKNLNRCRQIMDTYPNASLDTIWIGCRVGKGSSKKLRDYVLAERKKEEGA